MQVFRLAFWSLFTLAIIATFASLSGQNQDPLTVTLFYFTTAEYPKWVVLLSTFVIGGLFSAAFFIIQLIIVETKNIRLRRVNKKLERALAIANPHQPAGGKANLSAELNSPAASPATSGPALSPTQSTPWTPQLVTKPNVGPNLQGQSTQAGFTSSGIEDEV